jgi:hypothetical protein
LQKALIYGKIEVLQRYYVGWCGFRVRQANNKISNELLIFARLSILLVIEVGFVCIVGFCTRNRHNFGVICHSVRIACRKEI